MNRCFNDGTMCALERVDGLSGPKRTGRNRPSGTYNWLMTAFKKMDQCGWDDAEMVYPEEYLTKREKDMYRYGAGFSHPCEWYEYCRKCGKPCVIEFLDVTKVEPVGIVWKFWGWQCEVCGGKVWRVANKLYSALFLRQVPTGIYKVHEIASHKWCPDQLLPSRPKPRVMCSRVVKHCLWCKGRMMDDGLQWNWMICEGCKSSLEGMVKEWLSTEFPLPTVIVSRIAEFVFD